MKDLLTKIKVLEILIEDNELDIRENYSDIEINEKYKKYDFIFQKQLVLKSFLKETKELLFEKFYKKT